MRERRSAEAATTEATTVAPTPTGASSSQASLLRLQQTAGNQAVNRMVVQRASAPDIAKAKESADKDFAAGKAAEYFAGNFLANHIQDADAETQEAADKKKSSSKAARNQAFQALEDRADVEGGGSGWGPGKKMTGTNTLIIDYGVQRKQLMRAVNVGALDAAGGAYIHPVTEERMKTVTYSSKGERSEKTGKIKLGATLDGGRYKINHLGGVE